MRPSKGEIRKQILFVRKKNLSFPQGRNLTAEEFDFVFLIPYIKRLKSAVWDAATISVSSVLP